MLSNFPETKILSFHRCRAHSSRGGWDNMAALATTESEDPENRPPYTAPHSLIILCGLFVVPFLLRPSSFSTPYSMYESKQNQPADDKVAKRSGSLGVSVCVCARVRWPHKR